MAEYKNIEVEPSKMSTRGQIVIPQEIRKKMDLKKDALFMVASLDKETIVLKKVNKQLLVRDFLEIRENILKRSSGGGLTEKEIEKEICESRKSRKRRKKKTN
jgi:AbrB family looped-hinge helix DNA binding protein